MRHNRALLIAAGLGLVACAATAAIGDRLIARHVEAVRQEREQARLAVMKAAVNAAGQAVDRLLEWVEGVQSLAGAAWQRGELAAPDGPSVVARYLRGIAADPRIPIFQIAIIDGTGSLSWSTVDLFEPVDLGDREHFRVHRDGQRDLFISAPLVGRATGRPSIQFTRAIVDRFGDFAGVVVASVDPFDLSRELAAAVSTTAAVATLLRQDGVVLARTAQPEQWIGHSVPKETVAPMFARLDGAARTLSPVSQLPTLYGWKQLQSGQTVVAVGERAIELDAQIRRLEGSLRTLLHTGELVLAAVLLLLGALADRRRATRLAITSEETRRRMEEMIDSLPSAAYQAALDAKGAFHPIFVAGSIRRVAGVAPEAFLVQRASHLGDDAIGTTEREIARTLRQAGECTVEYLFGREDGQVVWLRERCRVIGTLPDLSLEVVGVVSDITDERALKAKAAATAKLATLGEMATGVAHELNQPCAAIALAADIASTEIQQGGQLCLRSASGRLEVIAEQAMRLRRTIDHFQIFGRAENFAEDVISIRSAIDGALIIVGGALHAAGVETAVECPPGLPDLAGDAIAFEHVLVNLIINARDAMRDTPRAARSILIAVRQDPETRELVLQVADRGTGLPTEVLGRVFEPFFTTKAAGEGTGLGLSVAYGTVQRMGGRIELTNRPGGGAIATLRFPCGQAAAIIGPRA